MPVRFMEATEIEELAERYPRQFVRGVEIGSFIAGLNIAQPLSDNPREDAIQAAAVSALQLTLRDDPYETQALDAIIQGAIAGVEERFDRNTRGAEQ